MILFEDVVHTDYGQFDIIWAPDSIGFDGEADRFFAGQVNGLVGAAAKGSVYLVLGRRSGGSRVSISLLADEPALDTETWEDIVEVSITLEEGCAPRWATWAGESGGPLTIAPGSYRMRVSARGRDAGHAGEFLDEIVDAYLIELWATPRPDEIVHTTSASAAYWHEAWGSRR